MTSPFACDYSSYDYTVRLPESDHCFGALILTQSLHSEMKELKFSRRSNRLPIILTIVFLIIVIIVGAVVWKVTKDAYDVTPVYDGWMGPTTNQVPQTTAVTQSTTYSAEELKLKPWLSLRMLRDVLPVHYDITMYPDFYDNGDTFYGNETIELQVNRPTKFILIHVHSMYMNVTKAQLVDNVTETDIAIAKTFYYHPNEFFVIETVQTLASSVRLKLQFEGSLTKAIVGIYKSTYMNTITKEKRHLAASKFEPTFARRAFPCFDEPNIKAEYTIRILHRPDYIALSNMPLDGQPIPVNDRDNLHVSQFSRSVKMSTYLVCFIVCDFNFTETASKSGKQIRVFATPDKVEQTHYALEMAKHTLDVYEELFNMTYPLPKQDLIAIPDFVSGAMEHWGLITFRESRLLYNPNTSTVANKINVATVVAHEMAHQWFGNIVTMDWWNDLWLNEGFASFMEYVGVDGKEIDWNIMNRFLDYDLFFVMKEDSQISSHPIVAEVYSPNEITSVFDAISYSKGSSVIRMLEAIMGKKHFFEGVSIYLKQYQWGNARTDDLWQALTQINGEQDVKHIMDTWTIQDGFPYINITKESGAGGTTTIVATQKRFLSNPGLEIDENASPFKYKWFVSMDYLSSGGIVGKEIMDMTNITFSKDFNLTDKNSWIKFNYGQFGYYIVLYPDDMWRNFSQYLQQTPSNNWRLSNADRAGLINDAFTLAESGKLSYEIALEIISYLSQETDLLPWTIADKKGFYYISRMLSFDADFLLWNKFISARIAPHVERLGFDDTGTISERELQNLFLQKGCMVGLDSVVSNVTQMFYKWLNQNIRPSVNIKSVVYSYGMKFGGSDNYWMIVWEKYLIEPSPQEKEALALSLSSTEKTYFIARLLESMKSQNGIKTQDFFIFVNLLSNNIAANQILWDWTRENYSNFTQRFTINDRDFGRMVYNIVKDYNTATKLNEVKDLFLQFPNAGAGERYRKMAIESIEKNIAWLKSYKAVIVNWLKSHVTDYK